MERLVRFSATTTTSLHTVTTLHSSVWINHISYLLGQVHENAYIHKQWKSNRCPHALQTRNIEASAPLERQYTGDITWIISLFQNEWSSFQSKYLRGTIAKMSSKFVTFFHTLYQIAFILLSVDTADPTIFCPKYECFQWLQAKNGSFWPTDFHLRATWKSFTCERVSVIRQAYFMTSKKRPNPWFWWIFF